MRDHTVDLGHQIEVPNRRYAGSSWCPRAARTSRPNILRFHAEQLLRPVGLANDLAARPQPVESVDGAVSERAELRAGGKSRSAW